MNEYVKYPRTFHLPWSLGVTSDDKVMPNIEVFNGKEVVVTEKMDGENTTMYRDHIHARSVDSRHHWSREWIKDFWARFAHDIPDGYRICGENLYTTHSIYYSQLMSFFYGFSVWEEDQCLSWDDTMEWFAMFEIVPVRTLYRGVYDVESIIEAVEHIIEYPDHHEGYVVRVVDSFGINDFKTSVGKFVRYAHVSTGDHWMHSNNGKNNIILDIPYWMRVEQQSL